MKLRPVPTYPPALLKGRVSGELQIALTAYAGFVMRAERVGAETLLAQIVRMVGEAWRTARRSSDWPTRCPPGSARR